MKNQKDDNWLNLFSGFKFWEWGEFDDWIEEWCEEQRHWQCKEEKHNLLTMCEEWWKKYLDVISGGNKEIARYIKCSIGRSLFDLTVQSKVMVCFSGREGAGKSFLGNIMDSLIGGTAVHSESSQDQGNSVFGGFQEPLLYATQVFLEENDPKKLNGIIGILKDYITKDRYYTKLIQLNNQYH